MSNEIINRVAKSPLITFDLSEIRPQNPRVLLDISQWLEEGFLLREKDFRATLKNHDWTQYQDAFVAMHCSTDALLPAWTYLLVRTHLHAASLVVQGDARDLEVAVFRKAFESVDWSAYAEGKVIVKGCSEFQIPEAVYVDLVSQLQPKVKSLMFGEACSTVPLYKAR